MPDLGSGLSPVEVLSDDVLVAIFLYFPAMIPSTTRSTVSNSPEYTWMFITHVCRRWRGVSLGCPLIWTNISFDKLPWVQVFLQRAQQAPLQMFADWAPSSWRPSIDSAAFEALDHLHHTRSLTLAKAPAHFLRDILPKFKRQTVEMLEVLTIRMELQERHSMLPPPINVELADEPFAQPAVRLRQLILVGDFQITWRTFKLFSSHLTHLHLRISKSSLPTTEELLGCFRKCPLEELCLEYCLPVIPAAATLAPLPEHYQLTDLPMLEVCIFQGKTLEVTDLIRRLRIPESCRVLLMNTHMRTAISTSIMSAALATAIDHICASRPRYQSPRMRFSQVHYSGCNLALEDSSPAPFAKGTFAISVEVYPVITTEADIDRSIEILATAFSHITQSYPLGSSKRLRVACVASAVATEDAWLVTLRAAQSLEVLEVEGACCYSFARAFALLAGDTEALPHLKTLIIMHAHLSYPLGPGALALQLESALTERRRIGAVGMSMKFQHCHVTAKQLHKLEDALGREIEVSGEPNAWGVGEESGSEGESEASEYGDDSA